MRRLIGKYNGDHSGPLLICFGGMHGNEVAGIEGIKYALKMLEVEPITNPNFEFRGNVIGITGNVKALRLNERYIDQDLNRMWIGKNIEKVKNSEKTSLVNEEFEMREIIDVVNRKIKMYKPSKVVVLDLHTTSSFGGIFTIVTDDPESLRIGLEFHAPVIQGMTHGLQGTLLHYFTTENIGIDTTVVTFESGQHTEKLSINRAIAAIINCMKSIGMVNAGDVENIHNDILVEYSKNLPKVTTLINRHEITESDHFEMRPSYTNFQRIQKGEKIAMDIKGDIVAEEDGLIVMPLYQKKGTDGFFMVKEVKV